MELRNFMNEQQHPEYQDLGSGRYRKLSGDLCFDLFRGPLPNAPDMSCPNWPQPSWELRTRVKTCFGYIHMQFQDVERDDFHLLPAIEAFVTKLAEEGKAGG